MRILDQLTHHWKTVSQPRQPNIWIDLFGKQTCAPQDLPNTLRRIEAFAEQEHCRITLVLVRNRSDRSDPRFHPRQVTLIPVDSPEHRVDVFLKQCRQISRGGGVIITGDADLEKQLKPTGVPLMRYSTFEKALALGPPSHSSTPVPTPPDRRHSDARPPRPSHPPQHQRSSRTAPPTLAPKTNSPNRQNAVLDLIDPL